MKGASVFARNALFRKGLIIRDTAHELLNELNVVVARVELARVGFAVLMIRCKFCLQKYVN